MSEGTSLADESGMGALSMRTLANHLGFVPMALYKHVTDKDDLIGAMIDAVVQEYAAPDSRATWLERVRGRVLSARDALVEHPWMRPAIEGRSQRSETVLAYMDAVAGDFIGSGFSADLTHYAMHALGTRIWGYSPEGFEPEPKDPPDAAQEVAGAEVLQQLAERYPNIAAITFDTIERNPHAACDVSFEFEFTLDLLLDAFARLHESGWHSSGH